jgi:hypothetical protein
LDHATEEKWSSGAIDEGRATAKLSVGNLPIFARIGDESLLVPRIVPDLPDLKKPIVATDFSFGEDRAVDGVKTQPLRYKLRIEGVPGEISAEVCIAESLRPLQHTLVYAAKDRVVTVRQTYRKVKK